MHATHAQEVEELPDHLFSCKQGAAAQPRLLHTMDDVLQLPPRLKVKWLRADCVSALDLSNPGLYWNLAAWQEIALCLHAVPALETLTVRLPRYSKNVAKFGRSEFKEQPTLPFGLDPISSRKCYSCQGSALHYHCQHCRYVPHAPTCVVSLSMHL